MRTTRLSETHKHAACRVFVLLLCIAAVTGVGVGVQTAYASTQPPTQFAITIIPANQSTGNALLQNLPTLFALDHLFRGASNGLLDPYQTTLGNILVLYRIFFGPLSF